MPPSSQLPYKTNLNNSQISFSSCDPVTFFSLVHKKLSSQIHIPHLACLVFHVWFLLCRQLSPIWQGILAPYSVYF